MQISAIGTAEIPRLVSHWAGRAVAVSRLQSAPALGPRRNGFTPCRRSAQEGFTLIELLVVLTIIGLMSAAVVLAMPDGRGGLVDEAQRFAARAHAARDRAIMDNRSMSIRVGESGYGFDWRVRGEWQPLEVPPFVSGSWKTGTSVAIAGGSDRILFDSTGFAEPANVLFSRGADRAIVEIANGGTVHVRP